eukprot:7747836-Lingulodinium_polyedra.AAC.1
MSMNVAKDDLDGHRPRAPDDPMGQPQRRIRFFTPSADAEEGPPPISIVERFDDEDRDERCVSKSTPRRRARR